MNFADFMAGLKRESFQESLSCCPDRIPTPRLCGVGWNLTLRNIQLLQQTLLVSVNRQSCVQDDGAYTPEGGDLHKRILLNVYVLSIPFICVCKWDGIQDQEIPHFTPSK